MTRDTMHTTVTGQVKEISIGAEMGEPRIGSGVIFGSVLSVMLESEEGKKVRYQYVYSIDLTQGTAMLNLLTSAKNNGYIVRLAIQDHDRKTFSSIVVE